MLSWTLGALLLILFVFHVYKVNRMLKDIRKLIVDKMFCDPRRVFFTYWDIKDNKEKPIKIINFGEGEAISGEGIVNFDDMEFLIVNYRGADNG